jgi:ubiquitin-like modifier-activating enzyme ATG7
LDQQCTVTRPGLSGIASAIVVELLSSILNHPLGPMAKSEVEGDNQEPLSPLGIIPHQIRGFLAKYSNLLLTGAAYDKCTACSRPVLQEYAEKGHDFIIKALKNPTYLEEITGLTSMKEKSDELQVDWDDEDSQ